MRNLLRLSAAGAILLLGSASVMAADIIYEEAPAPLAPVVADVVTSVYDWSGFYVGISGGYVSPQIDISSLGTDIEYGDDGYLIGGTVGYNAQFGSFVLGVEGDYSYAEIEGDFNNLFGFGFDGSAEGDYFATIRGRAGFAFDRVLVFGTGGVAFTELETNTPLGSFKDDLTGYTVGGGLEYAFTENLTVKGEYLYSDFDEESFDFPAATVDTSYDLHVVRAGVNYKF